MPVATAVADVLQGAERVVVIWGERIGREGEDATAALLDIAAALDLAGKDGSGLLEVPDLTNARGLREAGCLPDAGPGLSETKSTLSPFEGQNVNLIGKNTAEIRGALESGEIKTLLLFGMDPLRDCPDTEAWKRALAAADHVICFSMFENETTKLADVVFPLETYAEKDGTVTHPDGRLQRVRPSAARPGDIRPNWGVLAELALALDLDTGVTSQPSALQALTEAVPFYAGIDDAAIAGRGIRWQDREAASALPRPKPGDVGAHSERVESGATGAPSSLATRRSDVGELSPDASGSSRAKRSEGAPASPLILGSYRDLWAGPITELNPPLRFLQPEQRIELSPADAGQLGLKSGDAVRVSQNGTSVEAQVAIRERIEPGVCFLIEGTSEGNANALLNGAPVSVEIERIDRAPATEGAS